MIISKSRIAAAVERCLVLDPDLDRAIESVAQAMHLTSETVRECVDVSITLQGGMP